MRLPLLTQHTRISSVKRHGKEAFPGKALSPGFLFSPRGWADAFSSDGQLGRSFMSKTLRRYSGH